MSAPDPMPDPMQAHLYTLRELRACVVQMAEVTDAVTISEAPRMERRARYARWLATIEDAIELYAGLMDNK